MLKKELAEGQLEEKDIKESPENRRESRAKTFRKFLVTAVAIGAVMIGAQRCGDMGVADHVGPGDTDAKTMDKKVIKHDIEKDTEKEDVGDDEETDVKPVRDDQLDGSTLDGGVDGDIDAKTDTHDQDGGADAQTGDGDSDAQINDGGADAQVEDADLEVGDIPQISDIPVQDIVDAGNEDVVIGDTTTVDSGCINFDGKVKETPNKMVGSHIISYDKEYYRKIDCDGNVILNRLDKDTFTATPGIHELNLTVPWLDKNVQFVSISASLVKVVSVLDSKKMNRDEVAEISGVSVRIVSISTGSVKINTNGTENTLSEGNYFIQYGKDGYGVRVTNIDPGNGTVDVSIIEPFVMHIRSGRFVNDDVGNRIIIDGSTWKNIAFDVSNGIIQLGIARQ